LEDNYAGGYGGAIFTDSVPIYVDQSIFLSNYVISEGEFTEYASAGGAIHISTVSAGSVTSCFFQDNYVDSGKGGAIYLTGSSIITLDNNTFIRNIAYSSFVFKAQGGALALGHSSFAIISSSTFEMNMALPKLSVFPSTYSGNGGAIFFQSSNGNITDSLFLGNVVVSGQFDSGAVGGGIATENSEKIYILNSNFFFNSARGFFDTSTYSNSGAGGAIISQFSAMTVRHCLFRGNWVSAGGSQYSIGGAFAIYYDYVPPLQSILNTDYPVVIDSCEFVDNVAGGEVCTSPTSSSAIAHAGQGGAIGIIGFETGNVEITNTIFRINMALTDSQGLVTSFGGAIMYTLGSHVSCARCTFVNNIAWNGLGSDICSGYDNPGSPFSSLSLSKSYFDGASNLESIREHQRLVLLVQTLCFLVASQQDFTLSEHLQQYEIIHSALKISLNDQSNLNELPPRALRLSQSLSQRFSDQYRPVLKPKLDRNHWSNSISHQVHVIDDWNDPNPHVSIRRNLQLINKRVVPNILVMTGVCSVYEPILNSTYEICAGDLISLIIRATDDTIADSFFGINTKPQLSVIGSLTGENLILIGLSANITVVDQLNRQPVTLESLFLLNSTFFFSNNITISGSNLVLGSVLSSYVPPDLANATATDSNAQIQSLNIQGNIKTGFSNTDSGIASFTAIEFLLKDSTYLPYTTLQHCVLRIFGKLLIASLVVNSSFPSKFILENSSTIVIEKTGNMSLRCPVVIETEDLTTISLSNSGILDLSPQLEPSYLNPLEIQGYFVQSTNGLLIFGISNSNYSLPSLFTKTNQSLLGNILMQAVDGTVYSPSSETKSPTSWTVFQFTETTQRSDGLIPSYFYPNGTDFKLSLSLSVYQEIQEIQHQRQAHTLSRTSSFSSSSYSSFSSSQPQSTESMRTQTFVTSALSCSHRVNDYKVSESLADDDDYMCWICLKNSSCGYCGLSSGGCVDPGTSCPSHSFKKTDHNCCPHMCRGRGKCVAQNGQNTAFQCECWIFYQGSSCNNLSVFTYLLITAAVFIFLIGLITLRYYYYYRRQKAKVLHELRVGLLAGGNDPGENRSYIQAIQQDLILRDVFVNYDEIVFEGKIGEGSFGEVFKATFRGAQVAVKQMRAPVFMQLSDKDIEEFRSEAYMMSR
jgi:parallel beta-helix repeat protein